MTRVLGILLTSRAFISCIKIKANAALLPDFAIKNNI